MDLELLDEDQVAAFFTELALHAAADETAQIYDHLGEIDPTPPNIRTILMGLTSIISTYADMVGPDGPPQVAPLQFARIDDPIDRLVVEAGGHPGAEALTEMDANDVPRPVRMAAQITSAAIVADVAMVQSLTNVVVAEYLRYWIATDPGIVSVDEPPEAMTVVLVLVTLMSGFVVQVAAQVRDI